MLQQRKHAWTERKKKPKSEMTGGKCSGNIGKVSAHPSGRFHKTSSHRQHDGIKMSCCDGNTTSLVLKGPPGGGRSFRKCSLAMSQFLPPINALTMDGSLPLHSKQSSVLLGETMVRTTMDGEVWSTEGSPKIPEKENYDSAGQKETSFLGPSPGCALSKSVHLPCYWEEKPFHVKDLVDFMKPSLKKAPNPDLYKSCLLVLSTRRDNGKGPKAQQVPEIFRSTVGRSQTRSKTTKKDLLTWRSTEDLKGGEKQSSGDSAFGTDTWSENVEVDLELSFEMGSSEMDYYTHQRIINWILQVNAALFSPLADSLKCPLTEQDTSIKIVYEGD